MSKFQKNSLLAAAIVLLIVIGVFSQIYPKPFVSENRELTGLDFSLQEVFVYNPPRHNYGGDGYSIWVYKIPENIILKLTDYERLKNYPMWSALGFEYTLVKWQKRPLNASDNILQQVLERAELKLSSDANNSRMSINSDTDAKICAAKALLRNTTYCAYWYKVSSFINADGTPLVADLYFYIIDVEKRMLYKIAVNV